MKTTIKTFADLEKYVRKTLKGWTITKKDAVLHATSPGTLFKIAASMDYGLAIPRPDFMLWYEGYPFQSEDLKSCFKAIYERLSRKLDMAKQVGRNCGF